MDTLTAVPAFFICMGAIAYAGMKFGCWIVEKIWPEPIDESKLTTEQRFKLHMPEILEWCDEMEKRQGHISVNNILISENTKDLFNR